MLEKTVLRAAHYSERPEANDLTFINWDRTIALSETPLDTVLVFSITDKDADGNSAIAIRFQLDAQTSSEADLQEALAVMNYASREENEIPMRFIAFVVTGHDEEQGILLRTVGSNHKVAVHTTPEGQFCVTSLQ